MSSDKGRDRGGSFDSTRSEDGLTHEATISERVQNNGDGDLEKRLKEDKEKAIAVLKRVHPSRDHPNIIMHILHTVLYIFPRV